MELSIICLSIISLCLIVLTIVKDNMYNKERDQLINKIMAKDYKDYYLSELELRKLEQKKPEEKVKKTEFKI